MNNKNISKPVNNSPYEAFKKKLVRKKYNTSNKKIIININLNTFSFSNKRFDPIWIKNRINTFMEYTCNSLKNQSNQNFSCFIQYEDCTKDIIEQSLKQYQSLPNNISFISKNAFTKTINDIITKYDYLYLTRIDSDDMYHRDFVEKLHKYKLKSSSTIALINQKGYIYNSNTGKMATINLPSPPFYTLIYKSKDFINGKRYKIPGGHPDVINLPHEIIDGYNYTIVIHSNNDSTTFNLAKKQNIISNKEKILSIISNFKGKKKEPKKQKHYIKKPVNKKHIKKPINKNIPNKKHIKKPVNKNIPNKKSEKYYTPISNKSLNIASILDNFSYQCLKYEAKLIPLTPSNWKETLTNTNIDLLFVESAWEGLNGEWKNLIIRLKNTNHSPLFDIVNLCKSKNIPTIFWNKEDPIHFNNFLETAKLFDFIFTTDSNCVPKYKKILHHDNVFTLPFAAQPKIHNPINRNQKKLGKVAFSGSWYNSGHNNRNKYMEMILKPAFNYGLDIYDRHYYSNSSFFKFPNLYSKFIKKPLDYKDMVKTYKKYPIFLNVNSVHNSPTMFSRRVFEILASGTNIISSYSKGIDNYFSNIVKMANTKEDASKYLSQLLNNPNLRDKLSLLGIRKVMNQHTYRHRVEEILDKIDLKTHSNKEKEGVSVIVSTLREHNMNNILNNYKNQLYPNKELIIILNNNSISLEKWQNNFKKYPDVKIFRLDQSKSLGECLNFGVSQSKYGYISKFDDDDYYAQNYLIDLMNTFKYTDAHIVGKKTYFVFLKEENLLLLRYAGNENRYVNFVSGSGFIAKKSIFKKISFISENKGEDTIFFIDARKLGFKIYSADRFNFSVIRSKDLTNHTWKTTKSKLLNSCEIIGNKKDFANYISL